MIHHQPLGRVEEGSGTVAGAGDTPTHPPAGSGQRGKGQRALICPGPVPVCLSISLPARPVPLVSPVWTDQPTDQRSSRRRRRRPFYFYTSTTPTRSVSTTINPPFWATHRRRNISIHPSRQQPNRFFNSTLLPLLLLRPARSRSRFPPTLALSPPGLKLYEARRR